MKINNRETMERAIGIIEGASFGAPQRVQEALAISVEMLEEVLADEADESEGAE